MKFHVIELYKYLPNLLNAFNVDTEAKLRMNGKIIDTLQNQIRTIHKYLYTYYRIVYIIHEYMHVYYTRIKAYLLLYLFVRAETTLFQYIFLNY